MESSNLATERASAEGLVSDGCLTVDESMKFTGLRRSKLYEHLQSGRIPVVKVGRRTLIPKRALIRFLVEHLEPGVRGK